MTWEIDYSETATKFLTKLDKQNAKRIVDFMSTRVSTLKDPRTLAKPLKGNLSSLWRYRVGDYRIICDIQDEQIMVSVLTIGHRKSIYN